MPQKNGTLLAAGDAKTDAYAQVMSTRGYDSAGGSRRRWVGVELTDDGQHLRAHSSLHHSRVDSQVNVNDGRWHHLALVLSQSQKYLELYVDGERQGRADYPVTDRVGCNTIDTSTPGFAFQGKPKEVCQSNDLSLHLSQDVECWVTLFSWLSRCQDSDDPSSVTGGIEFCRSFACNVSRLGIWSRALQHGELARVTSSSCAEDDTNLEVYYQLDGDFADLRRQGAMRRARGVGLTLGDSGHMKVMREGERAKFEPGPTMAQTGSFVAPGAAPRPDRV